MCIWDFFALIHINFNLEKDNKLGLNKQKFSWAFFLFLIPLFNFSQIYNWSGSFGSYSAESGNAIDVDASGNTFIVGKYRNTVDFDPGNGAFLMTSEGESDIFILKLRVKISHFDRMLS